MAKPGAYRFYRFTFTPKINGFQVAEIALDGVGDPVAAEGYERSLDLMNGVARTVFTRDGVRFTRELVVSKPDEVIAMRLTADKPGALSFIAGLSRAGLFPPSGLVSPFRAEDGCQVMEGQLPFRKPGGQPGEGTKYIAILGLRIPQGKSGTVTTTPDRDHRQRRRRGGTAGVRRHQPAQPRLSGADPESLQGRRSTPVRRRHSNRRRAPSRVVHVALPTQAAGRSQLEAAHARAGETSSRPIRRCWPSISSLAGI